MDRVKETIFNVLGEAVAGARVLDLFSGSGSLGLEALSRGAREVYFVDEAPAPCAVIQRNLARLNIPRERTHIRRITAIQAIRFFASRKIRFDLIFVDPPFHRDFIKKILRLIDRFDIVKPFGKVILQRSRHEALPTNLAHYMLVQEKKIGRAFICLLVRKQENTHETSS